MSLNDPKGSAPAEAYDVSRPQGRLVRGMAYVSAGGYPFRSYSDIDGFTNNPVNIKNSERVTEEAH